MDRLNLLKNHLASTPVDSKPTKTNQKDDPKLMMTKYRSKSTINPEAFRTTLYGQFEEFISVTIAKLAENASSFKPYTSTELDRPAQRHHSLQQMKKVVEIFGPFKMEEIISENQRIPAIAASLYGVDAGLATKISVHFLLYGRTLMLLGSEKHNKYFEDAHLLNDIGCFALTELTHGSNVNGIRTRADYDHKTREFVINTPENTDMKLWIGAAGHLANMSVVFAQLYVGAKNHGVHAFVVPIRSKLDHNLAPGVVVGDAGLKVGLNSLDNGFMMFKNVRIPYDNLLDKFSSIDAQGDFQSPIKSAGKRFAFMMGALGGGRLMITKYSVIMLTNALTVAIRYAAVRRQFGLPNKPETNILEYPLVQYRLMPYLADLMAINCGNYKIYEAWGFNQDKLFDEDQPLLTEIHALTSVLKPLSSWLGQRGIQECREACGGLGYSAYNRLGAYREENDINTTWEGDNNVLLQQTAKFLLDSVRKLKGGDQIPYPTVYFVTEEPPVFERATNEQSQFARDGFCLKKAFEIRANTLIHICAERLQKEFMDGKEPMDIWNGMQVYYLQNATKAYAELYMLNEFKQRLEGCSDAATKKVFEKLYDLYAYNKLEVNSSIWLEIGYINSKDLSFVREKVVTLCSEVKDEAIGIIDAITLPDELLNSAIGAADGDVYNRFINAVWTAPKAFEKAPYWKEIRNSSL